MKQITIFMTMLAALVISCTRMDSTYKEFIKDGPVKYVGRVDSVYVYSGVGRVKFAWDKMVDTRVSKATVYWDNRSESREFDIDPSVPTEIFVDGLESGSHIFEIVTSSTSGHNSVPVTVTGVVYDDEFISSDYYSGMSSAVCDYRGITTIKIQHSLSFYYKYMELSYMSTEDGGKKVVMLDPDMSEITIEDCGVNDLSFRSVFVPDETCVDTLFSPLQTITPLENALKFDLSQDKVFFDYYRGSTVSVSVAVNVPEEWTASTDADWLDVRSANNSIEISVLSANAGQEVRTAAINLTAYKTTLPIVVTQMPKNPKYGTVYGNEGVIFWNNPERPSEYKIISASYATMPWSTTESYTGATSADGVTDGKRNVDIIKAMSDYGKTNTYAVSFCESLGEGWYLPSLSELRDEFFGSFNGIAFDAATEGRYTAITAEEKASRDVFNNAIGQLSDKVFCESNRNGENYLTSTEAATYTNCWYVRFGSKKADAISKIGSNYVRCVKKVEIN